MKLFIWYFITALMGLATPLLALYAGQYGMNTFVESVSSNGASHTPSPVLFYAPLLAVYGLSFLALLAYDYAFFRFLMPGEEGRSHFFANIALYLGIMIAEYAVMKLMDWDALF